MRPPAVMLAVLLATLTFASAGAQERITVFAAASLKNALDAVVAGWREDSGNEAIVSYAASSALAKQIEQGAPAEVFMSADLDWMAYLSQRNLTRKDTETRLLGNRMVLIAPKESQAAIAIVPGFDIAGLLGDGRLAMANVDAVPAGRYGKAALQDLGAWGAVEHKVAQAENVRAAMALVSIGEAPLGIVYQTDAAADADVKIIGVFPEETHPPIVYPVAELAASTGEAAGHFLAFLQSAKARSLFEAHGFSVLTPPVSN